jgi:general stress protein 26
MKPSKKIFSVSILCFLFSLAIPQDGYPQDPQQGFSRDTIIAAARDIINATHYCALATLDETGQPQVRAMNPFPLGDKIEIWFATNRKSRKVAEIKKDPRVNVYYADHNNASGYVSIIGKATVIDDKELLKKMKRDYWESIANWKNNFVLIKISPVAMDVTNYAKGVYGKSGDNRSPYITF